MDMVSSQNYTHYLLVGWYKLFPSASGAERKWPKLRTATTSSWRDRKIVRVVVTTHVVYRDLRVMIYIYIIYIYIYIHMWVHIIYIYGTCAKLRNVSIFFQQLREKLFNLLGHHPSNHRCFFETPSSNLFQEATPQLCWERKNCKVNGIGKSDSKICAEMLWPWADKPQVGFGCHVTQGWVLTLCLTMKHLWWMVYLSGYFHVFTCIYDINWSRNSTMNRKFTTISL